MNTRTILGGVLIVIALSQPSNAQDISIAIRSIDANQAIAGEVKGLTPREIQDHKVIVYVHTDQWYVHPFAAQGEGRSWAALRADGSWKLTTVQREHKADKIAAMVVKKNYPEPSKAESLESIQPRAIVIKELQGTKDYGKL